MGTGWGLGLHFYGGWVVASALSILLFIWVFPQQPLEIEYRSLVFLPILALHVILATSVYGKLLHGGRNNIPAATLGAVVAGASAFFLLWTYYQVVVVAKNGVWNPDVPKLGATAASGNATAILTRPPKLAPYGGCVLLRPSRCCPNQDYFARPNPELFAGLNLTDDEVDDVVCGTIDLFAGALDLSSSESSLYTPSSDTSKETCFASAAEAVCAFAFPRCSATCNALGPCLEVCDQICEEHVGLLPLLENMLANPGATFRSVALASTKSALGSCEDLLMADGVSAWTPSAAVLKKYVTIPFSPPACTPKLEIENTQRFVLINLPEGRVGISEN